MYDIAIVGGGLAGLSLAIQSADAGFSVVLFEKEEYPYHKVCGEYISLESWNFLIKLGVDLNELNLPIIKNLLLTDVYGHPYSFKLPLGGFGISRYSLDHQLYKIAKEKNVTFFTGTKVTDITRTSEVFNISATATSAESKIVAACYGKRSNLDIKWNRPFINGKSKGLNNYIGIKYHIRFNSKADQIALHNFPNGYCGTSKIENDKSCLCYLTTAQNLKNAGNSIKKLEQTFLWQNPFLKEIFTKSEFLYDQPLTISQVSFSKKKQVEDNILMLGDSAGMISPLCGNGMSMALHSSKLAFEVIAPFLEKKIKREDMEKKYIENWKKTFSKRLLLGRTVQSLFGGNTSTSFFLKTMKTFPAIGRQIIKSTHGKPF